MGAASATPWTVSREKEEVRRNGRGLSVLPTTNSHQLNVSQACLSADFISGTSLFARLCSTVMSRDGEGRCVPT